MARLQAVGHNVSCLERFYPVKSRRDPASFHESGLDSKVRLAARAWAGQAAWATIKAPDYQHSLTDEPASRVLLHCLAQLMVVVDLVLISSVRRVSSISSGVQRARSIRTSSEPRRCSEAATRDAGKPDNLIRRRRSSN
jgi:hypothetical protein